MADSIIRDPVTGDAARVTSNGEQRSLSIDFDLIAHISAVNELAFTWHNANYDYDAADTILLLQNTDAERDLKIHKMTMWTDTASRMTVHTTDGNALTPTGTAIVAVNSNRKSGKPASAIAKGDETANTQGNIIAELYAEADKSNDWDFDDAIILGNGQSIAVDLVTAGTGAIAGFWGFFEDAE
jgi:hypothetical protein